MARAQQAPPTGGASDPLYVEALRSTSDELRGSLSSGVTSLTTGATERKDRENKTTRKTAQSHRDAFLRFTAGYVTRPGLGFTHGRSFFLVLLFAFLWKTPSKHTTEEDNGIPGIQGRRGRGGGRRRRGGCSCQDQRTGNTPSVFINGDTCYFIKTWRGIDTT